MEYPNPLKLNVGCGTNKMPGWVNIDSVAALEPDLVHDITQRLPFDDASVDAIVADGILEHFDKYIRHFVFYEWARVLKIGGRITVGVPDYKTLLMRYFKFGFEKFVDTMFGENMLESRAYIGHFGNHKWGYSEASLKQFVRLFGIEPVSIEKGGLILRVTGEKKKTFTAQDLNAIVVYACANDQGKGNATLPLSEVRPRIQTFYENLRQKTPFMQG